MSDTSPKDAVKAVARLKLERRAGFDVHLTLTVEGNKLPEGEYELVLQSALSQVRKQASEKVPSNWLDPLLTGPEGIGPPPWNCPQIEKLLNGIKARLLAEEE